MQKEEIPSIHQEHQVDRSLVEHALDLLEASRTVSYTHLTLPTNREV